MFVLKVRFVSARDNNVSFSHSLDAQSLKAEHQWGFLAYLRPDMLSKFAAPAVYAGSVKAFLSREAFSSRIMVHVDSVRVRKIAVQLVRGLKLCQPLRVHRYGVC
jgi:hypothetical protein